MNVSINKFHERINLVENIGIEITKVNEDKAATAIQLNNLTTNINNNNSLLTKWISIQCKRQK